MSFAGTGQVAHALMRLCCFQVAIEEKIDPVGVLRSTHQEWAADAEGSSGAPNAQTGVATVAKRDRVQATISLQNVAGMLVRFGHQTLDAVRFLLRLDHTHG